jgi:four helix bundle protein
MKNNEQEDLGRRTRRFALAIVRLYTTLPRSAVAYVLGRQMLEAGTSVGAHYREARRAKSKADFVSKIEGALQELDETGYWLELLREASVTRAEAVDKLMIEVDELISILVSVVRKVKASFAPA